MPIFPHVCLKFNECLLLMLHKCFSLDGNVLSTANCRLVFDCSQRSLSVHGDAAIQRKKLQGQLFAVSTSTSQEVRDWWFANHGEGQMLRFVGVQTTDICCVEQRAYAKVLVHLHDLPGTMNPVAMPHWLTQPATRHSDFNISVGTTV